MLCALSLAAPWISSYEYTEMDLGSGYKAPSPEHPMGTAILGYDWLTRVLYGGRISLVVAFAAGALASVIGAVAGLVSGYHGRALDTGFMGLADLTLMLPLMPVILVLAGTLTPSTSTTILVLTLLLWPRMARLVRGQVLSVRGREYVEAARSLGVRGPRVILRHVMSNSSGILAIEATLTVVAAILAESMLAYLSTYMCGVSSDCVAVPGSGTDVQSWGGMLGEIRTTMTTQWWLIFFPGLMIVLTAVFVSFFGDGLRDAMDPRSEG